MGPAGGVGSTQLASLSPKTTALTTALSFPPAGKCDVSPRTHHTAELCPLDFITRSTWRSSHPSPYL